MSPARSLGGRIGALIEIKLDRTARVRQVNSPETFGVLFVCLGNICRSPAAHAVVEPRLARLGVRVDSAGLGAWHTGELPDHRSRAEGKRRGYRVDHRARMVTNDDFDNYTLIIAMEAEQIDKLKTRREYPRKHHDRYLVDPDGEQIRLLREWDPDAKPGTALLDPYYGERATFAEMYDIIERCAIGLEIDIRSMLKDARPSR